MTAREQSALTLLSQKDRPFFRDYAERMVFGRLVMMGLARCYVVAGGEQYVRLATEEERAMAMKHSAQVEFSQETR